MLAAEPPWGPDDEPSDAELGDYNDAAHGIDAHMPHEHLGIDHGDEPIDLESGGDDEGMIEAAP